MSIFTAGLILQPIEVFMPLPPFDIQLVYRRPFIHAFAAGTDKQVITISV
jgi:hypothetical protein